MNYLKDLNFTEEEISKLTNTLNNDGIEALVMFKTVIKANINVIKSYSVTNVNDIFIKSPHVFLQNPDKFKNKLDKYDEADLIEKLTNNPLIIEKL